MPVREIPQVRILMPHKRESWTRPVSYPVSSDGGFDPPGANYAPRTTSSVEGWN